MIVRDEAPIVTRALDSMKHIISSFYISDTGSVDGTPDIIRKWAEDNKIDGEVDSHEWVNFGHNKSILMYNARNHANPKISGADFFVWLDADEVWITDKSNPLSYPTTADREKLFNFATTHGAANIFMLTTVYGSIVYPRWNMCRNNQLYRWIQPVHEYFEGTVSNVNVDVPFIYLLARKEGNSSRNPDRYRRDAQMFLDFLKDNPNEPRATYYLAQTYESIDKEAAIEYYKKRIDIQEGYYQERYMACLRLGRMLTDEKDKMKYWLIGTTISNQRLECYYELMMNEYNKKNWRAAAAYGFMAPTTRSVPRGLCVEHQIYTSLFDLNFGVVLYNVPLYEEGIKATKRALETVNIDSRRELLRKNLTFFEQKLRDTVKVPSPPPYQDLIVIENFYSDPDKVRHDALTAEFDVKGNYPGTRTKPFMYAGIKEKFESIIGRKITYWPEGGYNGSFQFVTEEKKSWIHRDATDWSAIIFLTPNAPTDGGTKTFIHKETGAAFRGDVSEDVLNLDSRKEENWHLLDRVGNVYNRCVMFRGKRNHISDRYFGTTLDNARLFQTFFFDDGHEKYRKNLKTNS